MKTALLTLVRHGETSANAGGIWHGSTDTPLSERGHEQAKRVGQHLVDASESYHHIYSSPLQRARHTAEAISSGLGLEVNHDPGLTEYDLGSWEGKTYLELHQDYRLWDHMKEDPDFAPHGGESPKQVVDRYVGALRRIAHAHPGERVIVVGHGGALSMALAELIKGTYTSWGRVMDNCALTELSFEPEPALERFNFTDHLKDV
jgi:probable phosphoglycerate mutase